MSLSRADLALSQTFQRQDGALVGLGQSAFLDQTWAAPGPDGGGPLGSVTGVNDIIDSKYRVLSLLGSGGMGSVYRVRHLLLDKEMALKTFRRASLSTDVWQRFQREAQAIARLTHINIVQVFDFGIAEGNAPYYTMAVLTGESLSERIKRQGRLSLRETLTIFIAVAGALSHAHKLGIVHRDVKPANVFLDKAEGQREIVKVVDFGLAKLASVTVHDPEGRERQAETDAGLVFGSPLYMSPEQADGKPIDARTDLYSFGCSLFEALTGDPPFVGDNAFGTIQMHLLEPPPRLTERCPEAVFPMAMEIAMGRLLAKDLNCRYQSFDEVISDFTRIELMLEGRISRVSYNRLSPPAAEADGQLNISGVLSDLASLPVHEGESASFVRAKPLLKSLGSGPGLLAVWSCLVLLVLLAVNFQGQIKWPTKNVSSTSALPLATTDGGSSLAVVPGIAAPLYFYATADDIGQRRFTFPPGANLGYLNWSNSQGQRKSILAEGTVMVPANCLLTLDVSDELNSKPELLSGFRPDDLNRVTLNEGTSWNAKVFDTMALYLTGASSLDLNSSNFEGSYCKRLNHFEKLLSLELNESNIDGKELIRLERLRQLQHLNIGQIKNLSLVLQALKGDCKIVDLHITDTELSDNDLKAIGTLNSLRILNIHRSKISLSGLGDLCRSSQLDTLTLSPGDLKTDVIGVLHNSKTLKYLRIDTDQWSVADQARLKKALRPDCAILTSATFASSNAGYRRNFK